jgi:hypothetical protein
MAAMDEEEAEQIAFERFHREWIEMLKRVEKHGIQPVLAIDIAAYCLAELAIGVGVSEDEFLNSIATNFGSAARAAAERAVVRK